MAIIDASTPFQLAIATSEHGNQRADSESHAGPNRNAE
jgi:hypothetical protein